MRVWLDFYTAHGFLYEIQTPYVLRFIDKGRVEVRINIFEPLFV